MRQRTLRHIYARPCATTLFVLLSAVACGVLAAPQFAQTAPPANAAPTARTPSETVRAFYVALREKRFRDAFETSIYKYAIEGLSAEEFEDLRSEFENLANNLPANFEITGEQVSGDTASVFIKDSTQPEPVVRVGGVWLYGDRDSLAVVQREGKDFFPNARLKVHHDEVGRILQSISAAEVLYFTQHHGAFADLPTLLQSKAALRDDVESSNTLGYRFHLTLSKDGKSYTAGAEPLRYGHTGRLSFHLYQADIQRAEVTSKDVGGKPYNPPPGKKS